MNNKNLVTYALVFLLLAISLCVLRVAILGYPLKFIATQHDIVFRIGEAKE